MTQDINCGDFSVSLECDLCEDSLSLLFEPDFDLSCTTAFKVWEGALTLANVLSEAKNNQQKIELKNVLMKIFNDTGLCVELGSGTGFLSILLAKLGVKTLDWSVPLSEQFDPFHAVYSSPITILACETTWLKSLSESLVVTRGNENSRVFTTLNEVIYLFERKKCLVVELDRIPSEEDEGKFVIFHLIMKI
ncbi:hypothetical protein ROZALSC1DRAFT_26447 [Rozella allomycis CSF55]|uniref:Uncharacterized protein n=1 Tax=Rozella allomycis (strain CSF55) TaxID=988480 RepID=A0A075AP12_ROZAC|nr:hypothetical protein O9G_000206 [Rozella allomycis CSF55]RKP22151.1 hypothetical protein ROZALSC1DRAFT_26447 [Rozella allomycis CSF55]|eukprot:EPZ31727.1 hypothetical protein O9G_000206 [Rozella allomycis CSF55]